MKKSCFKTVEPFATKIIFCIVSIICVGLLACACQNELSIVSPRIQATELQSGTASSTVDSQITGTADPTNGTWLRFTAYNGGTSSVLLTNDDDVAAGIPLFCWPASFENWPLQGLFSFFWLMDASPFSRVHPYYARFGGRYSLDATFPLCHNTERDFLPQNTRKHKICSNFFAILSPS